ncbi:hypothetical protein RhiTH_005540 [Rhizoctonia solani]
MAAYPIYDITTNAESPVYCVIPNLHPDTVDLESVIDSEAESAASGLTINSENVPEYFVERHGRQQPASENALRFFPADSTRRYILRHILGKYLFGGDCSGFMNDMLTSNPERRFNVLELGTRDGTWAQDMAAKFPNVQFRSLDFVPVMAHTPRSNILFEVYDFAARILLEDSSQDIVFLNVASELVGGVIITRYYTADSVHQVNDYRALLRDVHRVLRPGGILYIRDYNLRLWEPQESPRLGQSLKPASSRIYDIAREVLTRLGGEPDICDKIPRWLAPDSGLWSHINSDQSKGFERVEAITISYPSYPHGTYPCTSKLDSRIIPVLAHYATMTTRDMFGVLRDGGMTSDEANNIIEASIEELKDPRRCSLSRFYGIQAVKRS